MQNKKSVQYSIGRYIENRSIGIFLIFLALWRRNQSICIFFCSHRFTLIVFMHNCVVAVVDLPIFLFVGLVSFVSISCRCTLFILFIRGYFRFVYRRAENRRQKEFMCVGESETKKIFHYRLFENAPVGSPCMCKCVTQTS